MKVTMETKQAHVYGGVRLKPGDRFEVKGQTDARLLTALGRAKEVTAEPAEEPRPISALSGFRSKSLSAQSGTTEVAAGTKGPKTGTEAPKTGTEMPKTGTEAPERTAPVPESPLQTRGAGSNSDDKPQAEAEAEAKPSAPATAVGAMTMKDDPSKRAYKRRDLKAEE